MAIPKIPAKSPSFATASSKLVALSGNLVANSKIKLSENRIEKLQSPATGRAYVYDTVTLGLAVAVSPQGKKVFTHYRKVGGKPRRVTLGTWGEMTLDEARLKCDERNVAIGHGQDPDAKVIRSSDTLQTLFNRYGEDIGATKKTWKNDQSMYRNHLAAWKDKRLSAITRDDVKALHAKIGRKHPTQANRVCELLCSLFAFAGWPIDQNPARGKSKHFPDGVPAYRETKRERFLSGEELQYFFRSLKAEENETIRDFILVALLVGGRRRNCEQMRFSELSFPLGTWTIPASKSKNASSMTLPLSDEVLQILRHRSSTVKGDWVFASTASKTKHLVEPKSGFRRVLTRAAEFHCADWLKANSGCTLEQYRERYSGFCADLVIHDLRRSFGSWQ